MAAGAGTCEPSVRGHVAGGRAAGHCQAQAGPPRSPRRHRTMGRQIWFLHTRDTSVLQQEGPVAEWGGAVEPVQELRDTVGWGAPLGWWPPPMVWVPVAASYFRVCRKLPRPKYPSLGVIPETCWFPVACLSHGYVPTTPPGPGGKLKVGSRNRAPGGRDEPCFLIRTA